MYFGDTEDKIRTKTEHGATERHSSEVARSAPHGIGAGSASTIHSITDTWWRHGATSASASLLVNENGDNTVTTSSI